MEKTKITTKNAPQPAGPYSQGIVVGDLVFVAGQRPIEPKTNRCGEGIKQQTEFCINNIASILSEAGSDVSKIIRSNVYLADIGDFDDMNEVYAKMIPEPYPVRTTIQATLRNILVEIEVIAHR